MLLSQYKNPILLNVSVTFDDLSDAEDTINGVLSENPGYCLAGVISIGTKYYVFDEDWGVSNPVHSVVLVELTEDADTQLPSVLSGNPGYHLVDVTGFATIDPEGSDNAFLLGSCRARDRRSRRDPKAHNYPGRSTQEN